MKAAVLLVLFLVRLIGGIEVDDFPRVYSAIVPQSNSFSVLQVTESDVHFIAEVDLVDVTETGIQLGGGAAFMKISFLVSSSSELERLRGLESYPTAQELMWDVEGTQGLHKSIDYAEGKKGRHLQEGNFETIAGFQCYKNLQGSIDWMTGLVARAAEIPDLQVERTVIGNSYLRTLDVFDGSEIYALKVTGSGAGALNKGIMMTVSGLHAREYAPPELVSRWIQTLVDGYGTSADVTALLDHTEIYAILQANPDGRRVAETNPSVMRRKNLRPGGNCEDGDFGVDLNRNSPFQWGLDTGSSNDPCAQTFRGASPASEPEVQAITDFVGKVFPEAQQNQAVDEPFPDTNIGVFIDVHSFGEVIIRPWAYDNVATPNEAQYVSISNKLGFLNRYRLSGPGATFFGEGSGTTDDYGYAGLGAASFTIEIGTEFYEQCNYFLDNILEGNMQALTYAASISRAPFRSSQGPDIIAVTVSPESASEGSIKIEATASDSERSVGGSVSAQQTLSSITVFVDVHPDEIAEAALPTVITLLGDYQSSTTGTGTSMLEIDTLSVGRHTLYIRATDTEGFPGPVSAVWFEKTRNEAEDEAENETENEATPSPVAGPIETGECRDDVNVKFVVTPFFAPVSCEWLATSNFRRGWCREGTIPHSSCPQTCGSCPGADAIPTPPTPRPSPNQQVAPPTISLLDGQCSDSAEPFQAFWFASHSCQWLRLNFRWIRIMCRASHPAWDACPETCGRCS